MKRSTKHSNKQSVTIKGANTLFASPFLNLYDLENDITGHYYAVSRHNTDELLAMKTYEKAINTVSDAVSCIVIFVDESDKAHLMLLEEFRFPAGQYVLAIPSGIIEDQETPLSAAKRELYEETGIHPDEIKHMDTVSLPLFTTPGLTDERVTFVCIIVDGSPRTLNHEHASDTELFRKARYISEKRAYDLLKALNMKEEFCSIVSWCALLYFQSGLWKHFS